MKILLVTQFSVPHRGGLSSHVEDLMPCLIDNGHKAKLLKGDSIRVGVLRKLINLFICGGRNDNYLNRRLEITLAKLTNRVSRLIKNNSFDIIHCHDPVAGYAVQNVLSGRLSRIPVVETIHGPLAYEAMMTLGKKIEESKYLQHLFEIEKQAFTKADHLIAVDTGQANIAINDFGINSAKVSVIFNSVSCKMIDSIIKTPSSIKIPKPYLLAPRRLVEKTGVRVAIESLARLDSDTKVNLAIAGDGQLKNELMQITQDLGLCERVIFLGSIPRQEVLRLASEALAVVVPSIPSSGVVEATSIAVIEAMACRTAVIASDIGGLAELIQHKQTGLLVPHSNPRAISEAITCLFKNQDVRSTICRQARQYVLENLDTPIWFSKVKLIYKKVLTN